MLWGAGISEPLPVAATFYTPDDSGQTMEAYACINAMVWCIVCMLQLTLMLSICTTWLSRSASASALQAEQASA